MARGTGHRYCGNCESVEPSEGEGYEKFLVGPTLTLRWDERLFSTSSENGISARADTILTNQADAQYAINPTVLFKDNATVVKTYLR